MRSDGLFDLQVNGFAGVDFNNAALTADALDHALEAMLRTGVTRCLPTIISAVQGDLTERFSALDRAVSTSRLGPAMVPGYHLEGPFLSAAPGYRGCHPAAAMRDADPDLVTGLEQAMTRPILLVTLAPEVGNAVAFTRWAASRGKVVALGHTAASRSEIAACVDAGARLSTHLGNGLAHTQHKFANPMMAQLCEPRLHASFIADGIHVPPEVVLVLMRARTLSQSILVTDAVAAAAAPAGRYGLAGMVIERDPSGRVTSGAGDTLAGSALTLDAAVRNIVAWGIADLGGAIAMASAAPSRLMADALLACGKADRAGEVEWTDDLRPARVRLYDGTDVNTAHA
jgi:N-acetylglucosamine-6-phosphate deacetylase